MAYSGVFSFGLPCLRAKQFVAFKNQYGVPGFLPPYNTRYLTVKITVQVHWINDSGSNFQDTLNVYNISFDRITSLASGDPSYWVNIYAFPYNQTIDATWQVQDDQYIQTINETISPAGGTETGIFKITTNTVQLTDQYTLEMLDADATDIIKNLMATGTPWGTVVTGFDPELPFPELSDPGALVGDFLPPTASFDVFAGPTPVPLKAVAWNIWAPGLASENEWSANAYSKLVSLIAMAGNYCLKTCQIDGTTLVQLSETCLSGSGSCGSTFEVDPPLSIAGQNSYTLLVPNCQCDS